MKKSHIAAGNASLRSEDFAGALQHYKMALEDNSYFEKLLRVNIAIAERRLYSAKIDIVVPVFNALEDVKKCLESLRRHDDGFSVSVIVVNDGSDIDTTMWLREYCSEQAGFQLIEHTKNSGYTKAVNSGLKASNAPYVITQNSDTIVAPGWLKGLIRCMNSSPSIGIVGPLSNAASWQNVPNLRDESGSFAVNALPHNISVNDMSRIVARASIRSYPRVPFVNGFCFMIRRAVINAIGFMDEENFPVGYGEENDFCIRAADVGFELAIADDIYVFHAKSKSFGHERRKVLSEQGSSNLKKKHTPEKFNAKVELIKRTQVLDAVRARIEAELQTPSMPPAEIDLMRMRILFLLPVAGGGGGTHSVVQEVNAMRRMGIDARVAVRNQHLDRFINNYIDISDVSNMFVGFDDTTLIEVAEGYDVVVGTIFSSMTLVKDIVAVAPYILPAYYVQDYEPLFFEVGTADWKVAHESYTLVPGAFLFAKTRWIIDEVRRHHGTVVHKVQPSIDHDVYKPLSRTKDGRIRITAMIRPQTPRRGAERTMRLLKKLSQVRADKVVFNLFGCASESPDFVRLETDYPFVNHGPLTRPQVADLLGSSDLFLDLSDYQAFGRTALEAMACGSAAVVPAAGGGDEYAIHDRTAIVVDTKDEDKCFEEVLALVDEPRRLHRLQRAGLLVAARYSVHSAAVSECIALETALVARRERYARIPKPKLCLLPSRRNDGLLTGSGYVRVALPYTAPEVMAQWLVQQTNTLPNPGSAQAVVIQREAIGVTFSDLQSWLPKWNSFGGKLIYEIDDDLMDESGLIERHYNGDITETINKVRFLAENADLVHVSTQPLADKIQILNPNVHIVPNVLQSQLWQLDTERDHSVGNFARKSGGPVRVGYIGTPTHDADLALVTEAMRVIEKKFGSKVEIEVIGGFQKKTPTFGKRIGLPKKNDYPSFVNWLQQRVHWDIGIIPLVKDDFNRSKSYLKFLEYAALDMAIVVSDAESYREIAKTEHNCLVSSDGVESWVSQLSRLIEDADLRNRLSSQARQDVRNMYTTCHSSILLRKNFQSLSGVCGQ